jgi:hypothetical protein
MQQKSANDFHESSVDADMRHLESPQFCRTPWWLGDIAAAAVKGRMKAKATRMER